MIMSFRSLPRSIVARSAALAAIVAVFSAVPAFAGAWLPPPGDHYSELGGSMFSTDRYYDLNATRQTMSGGALHEEHGLYSYNEYGWKRGRSFVLGFPYKSVAFRPAGTAPGAPAATGFGDLLVGLRFHLAGHTSSLASELDWNPPMGYDRRLSPRLGDGASNAVIKLMFGTPIGNAGFLELAGGWRTYLNKQSVAIPDRVDTSSTGGILSYKVSTKNVSLNVNAPTDQVLAGATIGFWIGRSVLVSGSYEGAFGRKSYYDDVSSLLDVWGPLPKLVAVSPFSALGGETPSGATRDRVSMQTAGPRITYRLDDKMDLIAGSMHTLSGRNAFVVNRYYVAIALKQTKLNRLQGLLGGSGKP